MHFECEPKIRIANFKCVALAGWSLLLIDQVPDGENKTSLQVEIILSLWLVRVLAKKFKPKTKMRTKNRGAVSGNRPNGLVGPLSLSS